MIKTCRDTKKINNTVKNRNMNLKYYTFTFLFGQNLRGTCRYSLP